MLSGGLPSAWGALTRLRTLDLASNALSGTLPAAWFGMASLNTMLLNSNRLVGTFPPSWQSLTNLSTVNVAGNCGLCGPAIDPVDNFTVGKVKEGMCLFLRKVLV